MKLQNAQSTAPGLSSDGSGGTEADVHRRSKERGNAIRVSIVEDDEWIRQSLIDSVNAGDDMRCTSDFGSGEEALVMLPKEKPDVVLMDIGLPKMSGIECVRQLKLQLPDTRVLMLTAYGDSERVFSALLAGASGYLLKRAVCGDLLKSIRQVYHGESPMNGHIARQVVQYFNRKGMVATEVENLSRREREVLESLSKGQPYKQIADELGISIETLRDYVKGVYRKLHVHSRGEAVAKYTRN